MPTLGTPRRRVVFHQGDSAEITAWPNGYDRNPLPEEPHEILNVDFTVRAPDQTVATVVGTITVDGSGFLRYLNTTQLGEYGWYAKFTFTSGEIRTINGTFVIIDPYSATTSSQLERVGEAVWLKLEDCFDSNDGGPWLRDMTMKYFEPEKMGQFVQEGLMMINSTPPFTELDLGYFTIQVPNTDPLFVGETTVSPDQNIVAQAALLATIRHLMRSYTEQPDARGANVVFEDRRDYLQRWGIILVNEQAYFDRMVALWKRRFYSMGHSALLVSSKAGRVYRGGSQYRLRNAGRNY